MARLDSLVVEREGKGSEGRGGGPLLGGSTVATSGNGFEGCLEVVHLPLQLRKLLVDARQLVPCRNVCQRGVNGLIIEDVAIAIKGHYGARQTVGEINAIRQCG